MKTTNSQVTEFLFCRPDLTNYRHKMYFNCVLNMFKLLKGETNLEPNLILEMLKVAGTLIGALFFAQFMLAFINDEPISMNIGDAKVSQLKKLINKCEKI